MKAKRREQLLEAFYNLCTDLSLRFSSHARLGVSFHRSLRTKRIITQIVEGRYWFGRAVLLRGFCDDVVSYLNTGGPDVSSEELSRFFHPPNSGGGGQQTDTWWKIHRLLCGSASSWCSLADVRHVGCVWKIKVLCLSALCHRVSSLHLHELGLLYPSHRCSQFYLQLNIKYFFPFYLILIIWEFS